MKFIENPVLVGRITKTHGVHGGMVVAVTVDLPEPDEWPQWAFVDIDGGLVPYGLQTDEVFFKDDVQVVVYLKGIDSPQDTGMVMDRDFYLPSHMVQKDQSGALLFPDLSDYEFRIKGEEGAGTFVDLIDIPSNRVFQLDWQGRELLIPAQNEFIDDIDEARKIIWLTLPEGLFHLN